METKRISINPVARLLPLLEVKRSPFGFVYWVAGRVYTRRGLLDELVGGERTTQIYGASAVLIFLFCKRKKKKVGNLKIVDFCYVPMCTVFWRTQLKAVEARRARAGFFLSVFFFLSLFLSFATASA